MFSIKQRGQMPKEHNSKSKAQLARAGFSISLTGEEQSYPVADLDKVKVYAPFDVISGGCGINVIFY